MDAIIAAYQPEWDRAIDVGRIKIVPKGSVYSTILDDDDSHDDGADSPTECASVVADTDVSYDVADDEGHAPHDGLESAQAVSSSNVKWYMICLVCGGMGHGSVVDGTPCLTKKLGNSISKSTLQKIKYPHGLSPPSLAKSTGEKSERGRPKFKGKFDKHAKSRSQSPRFREASEDESDHASRAFDKLARENFHANPMRNRNRSTYAWRMKSKKPTTTVIPKSIRMTTSQKSKLTNLHTLTNQSTYALRHMNHTMSRQTQMSKSRYTRKVKSPSLNPESHPRLRAIRFNVLNASPCSQVKMRLLGRRLWSNPTLC